MTSGGLNCEFRRGRILEEVGQRATPEVLEGGEGGLGWVERALRSVSAGVGRLIEANDHPCYWARREDKGARNGGFILEFFSFNDERGIIGGNPAQM